MRRVFLRMVNCLGGVYHHAEKNPILLFVFRSIFNSICLILWPFGFVIRFLLISENGSIGWEGLMMAFFWPDEFWDRINDITKTIERENKQANTPPKP